MKRVERQISTGRKKLDVSARCHISGDASRSRHGRSSDRRIILLHLVPHSQHDGPVCVVRASDGKRKIACVVPAGEHVRFHVSLE